MSDAVLRSANRRIRRANSIEFPDLFQGLTVDQFGKLLISVPRRYRRLAAALPSMPPDMVQASWNGGSGPELLPRSCDFVHSLVEIFSHHTGRHISTADILDYGCGWGRILRLLSCLVPYSQLHGADPSRDIIDLCVATNMRGHLAVVDYVPVGLPFGDTMFDLIFSFSVFTHLSEPCHLQILRAMRARIARDGLLVVTVRPPEYWRLPHALPEGRAAEPLLNEHARYGFAFSPLPHSPTHGGEPTYGDTSISLDYVNRYWKDWRLIEYRINATDPYQQILVLRPC